MVKLSQMGACGFVPTPRMLFFAVAMPLSWLGMMQYYDWSYGLRDGDTGRNQYIGGHEPIPHSTTLRSLGLPLS
jgi:hypothetical protein